MEFFWITVVSEISLLYKYVKRHLAFIILEFLAFAPLQLQIFDMPDRFTVFMFHVIVFFQKLMFFSS